MHVEKATFTGKTPRSTITAPPHPNDFADMLETLFAGNTTSPERPVTTTEEPWQRSDLTKAIQRMKTQKAADECGLVAEMLKHVPEDVLTKLLALINDLVLSGELPPTWQKTVFQMLPKTAKAMVTSDYRPIANIRVLYNLFTYLVFGRIENTLDCAQPEEQHEFRKNRRIEEHLVTANYVFDKTMLVGTSLWLISLDLSKAFDRVDWQALWTALETHGVSQHLVWIYNCFMTINAWLWARLLAQIGHRHGTISCMDGTTEYRYCQTRLDCNLGLSHA